MCALHQRIGEIDQEEEKEEKNIQKLNQRGKGGQREEVGIQHFGGT